MERDGSVHVVWSFDQIKKVGNKKFNLKRDLVRVIHRRLVETKNNTEIVLGYTKANFNLFGNEQSIFYAHPFYKGHDWYDWAIEHFEEIDKFHIFLTEARIVLHEIQIINRIHANPTGTNGILFMHMLPGCILVSRF